MYFYRTARDRTATVWRRCSVAVVVDRWRCRPHVEGAGGGGGVRSLGLVFFLNQSNFFFWNLAKKNFN